MKGRIEAISTKQGAKGPYYGLLIGKTWYTCFNRKCEGFSKGDEIEYNLVKKGEYTNLELIEELKETDVNSDMDHKTQLLEQILMELKKLNAKFIPPSESTDFEPF